MIKVEVTNEAFYLHNKKVKPGASFTISLKTGSENVNCAKTQQRRLPKN